MKLSESWNDVRIWSMRRKRDITCILFVAEKWFGNKLIIVLNWSKVKDVLHSWIIVIFQSRKTVGVSIFIVVQAVYENTFES